MDTVVRYIMKEVNLTEAEADAGVDPWEIVEDVLYKGTVDKVLNWLQVAEAASTAEYVIHDEGEYKLTVEQYKHKHGEK